MVSSHADQEIDFVNLTEQERHELVSKRYRKLYLIVARRLKTIVNRHRVREIQKYLDYSVLHLDLISMMKVLELHPSESEL